MSDETRRAIEDREAAKRPVLVEVEVSVRDAHTDEPRPRYRRKPEIEPVAFEDIPVEGEVE